MYSAILITTEGCMGCNIMRDILKKAISEYKDDVTLETVDCADKSVRKYIKL